MTIETRATLLKALREIEAGAFPQAVEFGMNGQWKDFCEKLQEIARDVLPPIVPARATMATSGAPKQTSDYICPVENCANLCVPGKLYCAGHVEQIKQELMS